MLSINWVSVFKDRHDNDLGNQDSSVFSSAWSQQTTPNEKVAFISNDNDIVLLAANANKTLAILHSFKNIGVTLLRPSDKLVCFLGTSVNATAVAINMASITGNKNIRSPSIESLFDCDSAAEISSLPIPPNNSPITSLGCFSFLPAPWLVSTILSSGLNDPLELIVECKAVADLFDMFHAGSSTHYASAVDHLEDFACWAWPPSLFLQSNRCHPSSTCEWHISSEQRSSSDKRTNVSSARSQHQEGRQKKDRLKKLHPSVSKFLLFASAKDSHTVPSDVTEACKRFINSETEGLADLELNIQFQERNFHDVNFSSGFTQAIYNGRFRWSDQNSPSNFSPFSMFEVDPIQASEQQNHYFILHIILTQGKIRTIDEIKSSNKQIVKAPSFHLEMIQQLKYFAVACDIFFGKHSAATASLISLISVIKKYKHPFKAKAIEEETFASKFVFAVDKRMQLWFESISQAKVRSDVNDSPLNFSKLVDSIRYGNFVQSLPITFSKSNDSKKRPADDNPNKEGTKKPKDKPDRNVTNPNPIQEFKLLTGKTWVSNFAGKKEGKVKWDKNSFMCPCWWILGRCFLDCSNSASHVESASSEKLCAFTEFLNTCRAK